MPIRLLHGAARNVLFRSATSRATPPRNPYQRCLSGVNLNSRRNEADPCGILPQFGQTRAQLRRRSLLKWMQFLQKRREQFRYCGMDMHRSANRRVWRFRVHEIEQRMNRFAANEAIGLRIMVAYPF